MRKIILFGFGVCVLSLTAFGLRAGAAVRQDAGPAAVYYRDGARFALAGRLEEAVEAFEQSAALDPRNGNTYYSLGNVYSEMGRWTDAVAAYRKAVSLNKNDVEAYNGLGVALSRRGLHMQAAAAFERAVELYPKWAEPHFHLSQVRGALRQEEAARAAYAQAIRLRPDYASRPPKTFVTAELKAGSGVRSEKVSAGNVPAAGSRTSAGNTPARGEITHAVTPAAAAAPPRADEAASNAGRFDAGDAGAYYDSGVKHGRAGRHDEAIKALRQSIIMDRNNAGAHLALGDAYAGLGRWRESVDAYEQAARLNPNDAETYRRLGKSYAKLRETTPAGEPREGAAAIGERASAPPGDSVGAGGLPEKSAPVESRAAAEAGFNPTAVYLVGPGDTLDVRVAGGREAGTSSYKVTPTGLLDHPRLAAPLQVKGLTTEQIAARLGAELRGRAAGPGPEIVVGVREYASHAIIVSGLVKDPGTKILQREGVPLYVIIAHAQPLPAAGQALVVSHATGQTAEINLADGPGLNILVRPGDVITLRELPEQYFYVAGAVKEPGQRKFHTGLTLTQAVLTAGGATSPGAGRVRIARQGADGRLSVNTYDLREIGAGSSPDPVIRPGDRIEVLR